MIDVERSRAKYRRIAPIYDLGELAPFRTLRRRAVHRLALRPGEVVLDLGCGTGASFALLEEAVGPSGKLVGLDLSPDMLSRARSAAARGGWTNITLIEANAEEVTLERSSVDAVLSFFTHDIMRSRPAVERAVIALRAGGRFVAAGGKRAIGLRGLLLNPLTLAYSLPFVTTLSGAARPWTHLEDLVGSLVVDEYLCGTAYVAHGTKETP